jgi:hypothetical protein
MTSAMAGSGPIAVRRMPMLRDAAFNLRERIPSGIVDRLARSPGQLRGTGFGKFNN